MPTDLVDDIYSFPVQTTWDYGEARTVESFRDHLQRAADRIGHVAVRAEVNDPTGEGIRRLRTVASLAALRALTDHPDGSTIRVGTLGTYTYYELSAEAELEPQVIQPTDVGVGQPGRWIVDGRGVFGVAGGVATLDASGRIPGTALDITDSDGRVLGKHVRNGIVQVLAQELGLEPLDGFLNALEFLEIENSIFSIDLEVGDVAMLNFDTQVAASGWDRVRFRVKILPPTGAPIFRCLSMTPVLRTTNGALNMRQHLMTNIVVTVRGRYRCSLEAIIVRTLNDSTPPAFSTLNANVNFTIARCIVVRP